MKNATKYMVFTGVSVALGAAALATIANKRWWGHRINAKWDVHTGSDPNSPWTIYGPDFKKWTFRQLIAAWKDGVEGWYPKGETPELETGTEFDV